MSMITTNEKNVQEYVERRITEDHTLKLDVYANGSKFIVTPQDSDKPEGYTYIGYFLWHEQDGYVDYITQL